jgi:Asp-tRNA(Asn)/Glu-tRNA(Gln) amidotransferase B subunit
VEEPAVAALFDASMTECPSMAPGQAARQLANLLLQAGAKLANERGGLVSDLGVSAAQLGLLAQLREADRISSNGADEILARLAAADAGANPEAVARREGLLLVRDEGALAAWCDEVIGANSVIVEQIRGGKDAAIGRLIGAVMQRSGGAADPKAVRAALLERMGVQAQRGAGPSRG